jgi:hypothetical protein
MTNEAIDKNEVLDATRADGAARQNPYRARRDLELEGLSVKKMLALKASRSAALSATIKAAEDTLQHLTPEQREIFDNSVVFREGAEDGSSAGLRYLQSQMFDLVSGVRDGEQIIRNHGVEVRGDWVAEYLADFLQTYPWAKPLVFPRSFSGEAFRRVSTSLRPVLMEFSEFFPVC